jgi:mono/diheme cytochrome c family protein
MVFGHISGARIDFRERPRAPPEDQLTEVPEYLLRRSRERREALGLATGGGETPPPSGDAPPPPGEPSPSAAAPAAAAEGEDAVPAVAEPEPAAAVPTYIAPRVPRSGIPIWMFPVLVILPFWAIIYVGALAPPQRAESLTPIQLGAKAFTANCASCHGANGEGVGEFPKLAGQVLLTFPNEADHVKWVQEGSQTKAKGTPYGDPARPGGQHVVKLGKMPAFASTLSPEELNAVVLYERETFK